MTNPTLINADKVIARATILNCEVVDILANYVLCKRKDDTYITWAVGVHGIKAELYWGHYDMTEAQGYRSLVARAYN
jgi:hypothetical protein